MTTLCTYSICFSTSDLLSCIIFNTDKHKFTSIWKWIHCSNDVMNYVDFVIDRDFYPQKMHSCSKNIRVISFYFVLKIFVVYQEKYIIGVVSWVCSKNIRVISFYFVLKIFVVDLYQVKYIIGVVSWVFH